MNRIKDVQKLLKEKRLDGWLLYDFRKQNDLACGFLEIDPSQMLTRRFFYWIPVEGEPHLLTHAVESFSLPGTHQSYTNCQDLSDKLNGFLDPKMSIAMEVSPIPYLSKVDGYTLDFVRSKVQSVVSSGDILQYFTSLLTHEQAATHLEAASILEKVATLTWEHIKSNLGDISEWDVQNFILQQFREHRCVTDDSPICGVNEHSADPHYSAQEHKASIIKEGDFILIDLWTRLDKANSCYADITQVGVAGEPTALQSKIFDIVKQARDAAIHFVQEAFQKGDPIRGCDVDRVARKVIQDKEYGDYFIHRLGHNIYTKDHGPGANMDSYETEDTRLILPNTCFSIEPGIYLPGQFGVRLECDMLIQSNMQAIATGGLQNSLVTI